MVNDGARLMPKFKLICDHSCDLDTHVVTHEFDAEYIGDVLDQFKHFLRGAGYYFDGEIDIVDPDPIIGCDNDCGCGTNTEMGGAGNKHSHFYFDLGRNR
jgi:hypothetical protein